MSITLSPSNWDTAPKVLQKMSADRKDGLYKASLPNTVVSDQVTLPDDASDVSDYGYVYTNKKLKIGSDFRQAPNWLKNADGSTAFSLTTTADDVVSLVSSREGMSLYVYSPNIGAPGTTKKYSFDRFGVYESETDISAAALSTDEISAKRDLDGNGKVGGQMAATLDSQGGLYKATVGGQDFYIAGSRLHRARVLDVSRTYLRNTDGTAWSAPTGTATIVKSADDNSSWDVYVTDTDVVTRYRFNNDLALSDETTISARELASAESIHRRDLNSDSFFGLEIEANAIDSTGGLFQGNILGQDFLLVGNKLGSGTQRKPTDLSGALINSVGSAWEAPVGFSIKAAVKSSDNATLSIYAVSDSDETEVLKFVFSYDIDNKTYNVDPDYIAGELLTAETLAEDESAARRDLNNDTFFGVAVVGAPLDREGGLYLTEALGNQFIVVGKGVVSSEKTPLDLSTALKDSAGNAWYPDGVDINDRDSFLISVVKTDDGFDVVVLENADANSDEHVYSLYQFNAEHTLINDRIELTTRELATLEKNSARDLNADGAIGIKVTAAVDSQAGLYRGELGADSDVFLFSDTRLTLGSTRASLAQDFSSTLQTDAGDLWQPETDFSVKGAYQENSTLFVIAKNGSTLHKYSFSQADSSSPWTLTTTEATTVLEVASKEIALRRDLDGDGNTGHSVVSTLDKIGKLHNISVSGNNYHIYFDGNPKGISSFETVLLNESGEDAWTPTAGHLGLTFTTKDGGGFYIYEKTDVSTFTRFEFDDEYKQIGSTGTQLSLIELAEAEVLHTRDLNADRAIGAKVSSTFDRSGGLHQAQLEGSNFIIVHANPPRTGVDLAVTALLNSDGIGAWEVDAGFSLKTIAQNEDDDSYQIFAVKNDDQNVVRRYSFDANRVFTVSEDLSARDLALDEQVFDRDLNSDKAIGLRVDTSIDRAGGLFKASILGSDYYLLGVDSTNTPINARTKTRTGSGADTAPDFSKVLLDEAQQAWGPADGYSVAGVHLDDDSNWNVYTYKVENSEYVVKRSVWNSELAFQGTVEADPVTLVNLEATKGRDFSGDGKVGFRVIPNGAAGEDYKGVTQVKISGTTGFWIAGADRRTGTSSNPIRLADALLNQDGSGPWIPEDNFLIKSVVVSGTDRFVYAVQPADANNPLSSVYKYKFDNATGYWDGEAPTVLSAIELAAEEVEFGQDLDDNASTDNGKTSGSVVGAAFLTDVQVNNKSIGLIKASSLADEFYLVRSKPSTSERFDLTSALLNADGTAWKPNGADATDSDTGIGRSLIIKGLYAYDDNGVSTVELFGLNASDQIEHFKFQQNNEDADDTSFYLVDLDGDEGTPFSKVMSGSELAAREATAARDLNADTRIGFKYVETIATQPNGFNIATAKVDYVDADEDAQADQIYFVATTPDKAGLTSQAIANSSALYAAYTDADNFEYWSPDENFSVISLVSESATSLHVYAKNSDATGFIKYSFGFTDDRWIEATAELEEDEYGEGEDSIDNSSDNPLTNQSIVAEEVTFKRDLNADGFVGLEKLSALGSQLIKATAGGDSEYLIAGSNLTSGSQLYPLGFDGLLRATDGTKWLPDNESDYSNLSVTSFGLVNSSMNAPDTAAYRLVGTISGGDSTEFYFDSAYKYVEA